jgi:hypothetical protein
MRMHPPSRRGHPAVVPGSIGGTVTGSAGADCALWKTLSGRG